MMKKMFYLLLFVTIFALDFSCKKIEYIDPYPIAIKVENALQGNEISWTAVNTSDFAEYKIWRTENSTDTIEDNFVGSKTLNLVGTVTDIKKTSFIDDIDKVLPSATQSFYYRVEVVLKNRHLWSRNILFSRKNKFITEKVSAVEYDKSRHEIYVLANNGKNLYVFNTQKEEFVQEVAIPIPSVYESFLATGKVNGRREVYVAGDRYVYVVDVEKGKIIESFDLDTVSISSPGMTQIVSDGNGKLLISTGQNYFFQLDRNNQNNISRVSTNSVLKKPLRIYTTPETNTLLAVEPITPQVFILKTNNDQTKIENIDKTSNFAFSVVNFDFSKNFVLDANNFILSRGGYVLDRNLKLQEDGILIKYLDISQKNHYLQDLHPLEKDKFISVAEPGAISNSNYYFFIHTWKLPRTIIKEKQIMGYTSFAVVPFDDVVWVVMSSPKTKNVYIRKHINF
jgi:outer membrane protein assembly factor BamB